VSDPHFHEDERGLLVRCYHSAKTEVLRVGFWVGLTLGFPLEHYLYDHVWPFTLVRQLLGLS